MTETAAPQQSDEWRQARCGHATASRIGDIIARTKTGWGASRDNYASEIIAERLTGAPLDNYQSAAMARGIALEPQARVTYEFRTGQEVELTGFVKHPMIPWSGASPDGLVGGLGLVSFKCPELKEHIRLLLGGSVDKSYRCQMLWEMSVTGRAWEDFVSFHPGLPEEMQMVIRRFTRRDDEESWLELHREVPVFLREVEDKLALLRQRFPRSSVSLREKLAGSLVQGGAGA